MIFLSSVEKIAASPGASVDSSVRGIRYELGFVTLFSYRWLTQNWRVLSILGVNRMVWAGPSVRARLPAVMRDYRVRFW